MDDKDWKQKLTPDQYRVLREKGTEVPFTGRFLDNEREGIYTCVACGAKLFTSDTKYESDIPGLAGWPSFGDVVDSGAVRLQPDNSLGMSRTEVVCANCGGHLGHLFDDEQSPTGQHYCVNSVCLEFQPKTDDKA
jgi:peptide-methionine (R)-S-oxide reductase